MNESLVVAVVASSGLENLYYFAPQAGRLERLKEFYAELLATGQILGYEISDLNHETLSIAGETHNPAHRR